MFDLYGTPFKDIMARAMFEIICSDHKATE